MRKFFCSWLWTAIRVCVCVCVFVVLPTGQWRPGAADGERKWLHYTVEWQEGHLRKSTRRTQMEMRVLFMSACAHWPACTHVSGTQRWDLFEQREQVGEKPFTASASMPGCRGKTLCSDNWGGKIESLGASVVETWNKLFMTAFLCPHRLPSALPVGFHRTSAAVRQQG